MSIIVSRNIELMNSLSSPMISAIFELKFCVDCFSIRFNEQQNYSFQDIAPYEFKHSIVELNRTSREVYAIFFSMTSQNKEQRRVVSRNSTLKVQALKMITIATKICLPCDETAERTD